ncbi:hypothetical protein [uncultured Chitinophaga sp.]|uniref:hypothetical protein n=1 Tax=uncultured Chitinophaga sp. TaxID=339340 RepID=UPI0025D7C116|nr:hypothetical protein [uncultured Chitinophaga sp.]
MCLKKRFFSVLLSLGFAIPLVAQYQPGRLANGITPNISLPSAEAASLGKYGEWPVSLYTGTASITVPLYEIKIGSFSLPIQLSYHTGGVKVDDVASWTGVNWTLSAGGAITRAIMGMEDESQPNGFLYRNQHNISLKTSYNLLGNNDDYVFIRKVARNEMDTEPDIFYYNFGGQSGSFYFDEGGKMRCKPASTLKLLKTPINTLGGQSPTDKSWELADAQGNVYTFGGPEGGNGVEESKTFTPNTQSAIELSKITGYYLTKIILNNGLDTVYFDYVQKSEMYELPYTYSLRRVMSGSAAFNNIYDDFLAEQVLMNGVLTNPVRARSTASGFSMLRKIRWSGGEVVFNAAQARQDVSGGVNLTSVAVYNKKQQKIKETVLSYEYVNQRYFLAKTAEGGSSGADSIIHKFEYYTPSGIAARFSTGQDHWGYYNGATANAHLLPPHFDQLNSLQLNANREPSEAYMNYGALKSITYPTGGYTEFYYEANRYAATGIPGGGSPPAQLATVLATATTYYPQANTTEQVYNFTVPMAQTATNTLVEFENYGKPPSPNQSFWPKARIEMLVGQTYQTIYSWDAFYNFPSSGYTQNPNGTVSFNISPYLSFQQGTYRIVTEMPCNAIDCDPLTVMPSVKVSFNYTTYVQTPPGQLVDPLAGGLRIKEIVNESNAGVFTKKRYTYSTGNILIYPSYFHEYGADEYKKSACFQNPECIMLCPRIDVTYREVISAGTTIMGLTQGSPVGYTQVREAQVSASGVENGYSISNFSFTPDTLNEMQYDPSWWSATQIANKSMPINSPDYKRGLLIKKEGFKSGAVKLYSIENEYNFNDGNATNNYSRTRGLRAKSMFIIDYVCGTLYDGVMLPSESSDKPKDFGFAFYHLTSSWLQTKKTTETTWDENGANPVVSETLFSYANPSHMQVTSMQTADSKGNTIKYDVKYPSDFASSGTPNVYNKMLDRNLVGAAIEETKSIIAPVSQPLSQQRVNYTNWQNDKVIAPATVQSVTGNTVLNIVDVSQIDARIHSYDAVGRATEFEGRDQLMNSIVWGVDRNTPLAKIANASAAVVAYTSFEDGEWGGWTVPAAANTDATALTGSMSYSLGSGSITKGGLSAGAKYKVSYWTKNGSPYTVSGTQGQVVQGDTHRGWTRFEHLVTGQTSVTVSGSGSIDHVIVCPEKAMAETYTAIPLVGITSKVSPDGKIVYYEYDALGRMKVVKDQDGAVLNMFDYKYQVSVP